MRKLILFMHTSLDGFVAGPNGEMDWINVEESLFDFVEAKLTGQTDTALYGRITYELMESYWPTAAEEPGASRHDIQHAEWYKNAHKIVLSRSMKEEGGEKLTIISGDLAENITREKQKPGKDILIFGSPSAAHSLMELDLIDGYWLFVNPILLSKGLLLFNKVPQRAPLRLISTEIFESGVICSYYERQGLESATK